MTVKELKKLSGFWLDESIVPGGSNNDHHPTRSALSTIQVHVSFVSWPQVENTLIKVGR